MTSIDLSTGRIFFEKCYYDVQGDDMIHDAGPFSDKSCNHGFNEKMIIPQEEIDKVKEELDELYPQIEQVNQHLLALINSPDLFQNENEEFDITDYIRFWRFLEIPKPLRKDFNLILSMNRDRAMLCTYTHAVNLMKNGNYTCKYSS